MKKLSILLLSLFLVTVSCDSSVDFGDINLDKDAVVKPDAQALMAGAMNRFFTLTGRDYLAKPTLYVQYQAQNVYTDEQRYNQSPASWYSYYVGTLSNFKEIVDLNSVDEVDDVTKSYGHPDNQIAVSELFSCFVWKRVTDTWGPVPYTEALGNGETITPSYTDQETIYRDLIARVKAARDRIKTAEAGPTGDVVYGGDMEKWKKFANSFLLSLTIQLSKKYPASDGFAATEFKAALNHPDGVIETVDDEMWYLYANQSGAVNPFSQLRGADYALSVGFTDALSGRGPDTTTITYSNSTYDARLNLFASDPTLPGQTYGVENSPSGDFATMNTAFISAGSPLPYLTAAYTYLNRAEAAQLGWTTEDVATMFTNGVTMSFQTLDDHYIGDGSLAAEGAAFAAARLADFATASPEQVIGEEKWVALFPMGFQAWSEWRRTGYPILVPAPEPFNDGSIPTRYLYPSDEPGVNTANYEAALEQLTPPQDINTATFWWQE